MTEEHARALAAEVALGGTLKLKWESDSAFCWGSVRYEPGRGFVGTFTEAPHDVLSPWRDREEVWSEAGVLDFLRSCPDDAPEDRPVPDAAAPAPRDAIVPAGRPHRTMCDVEVLLHDYDALGVKVRSLPAGTVFQPWEPRDHWRGVEVPITLGSGATELDWGVTSLTGHFLRWDDFFTKCEMMGP